MTVSISGGSVSDRRSVPSSGIRRAVRSGGGDLAHTVPACLLGSAPSLFVAGQEETWWPHLLTSGLARLELEWDR